MLLPQAIPAVWVYTTGDAFNASRAGGYGSFLSPAEQARLERIRQARLLFDGKHKTYFLDEQRTQFDFPPVRAGNRVLQMYLTYNVLGLISLKAADLLFGEEPLLTADDPNQQKSIEQLAERCNLHLLLYGCAVDASYEAECFLGACVQDGEVYLQQLPADEIFPQGEIRPNGQYASYKRYAVQNVGTEHAKIFILLETIYKAGSIERRLWQLGDDQKKFRELTLDNWPMPEGSAPMAPVQFTGIADNTVTWVANLLIRKQAVSDYDGAIDLQDALNAKNSQVGRVLLKHADPKMAMPTEAFDAQGNIRSDAEVFPFADPNNIPKYITWNAELAHAMTDRSFALNQLLVRTETSPVLLGLKEGAAPDAYKKVRLESFNSLTKAARKAAYWKAGIKRAVSVAQALEQTLPGVRYDMGSVAVALRDGIPIDEKELAETQALKRASGTMSLERALSEQIHDPPAEEKELARLEKENAAKVPSTFLMGDPNQAADAGAVTEPDTQPPSHSATPPQFDQKGVAA